VPARSRDRVTVLYTTYNTPVTGIVELLYKALLESSLYAVAWQEMAARAMAGLLFALTGTVHDIHVQCACMYM
jgi:hypothetical protein